MLRNTITVLITGAAGNLSNQFIPLLCSGNVFGDKVELNLNLYDLQSKFEELKGLSYEIEDCNFKLVKKIQFGCDPKILFKDIDIGIFMGAQSRKPGMEKDLLNQINANIYKEQGKYLNEYAKNDCKIIVVANPVNLNCLSLQENCPKIPKSNFTCLMRLDNNRAKQQIAQKCNVSVDKIKKMLIWGNHSLKIYPDISYCEIDGKPAIEVINDQEYITKQFTNLVKERGKEIMKSKKTSAIISGAYALMEHLQEWCFGTEEDDFFCMGVRTDGDCYNIPEGLIFCLPVKCKNFEYEIVKNLKLNESEKEKIQEAVIELSQEKQNFLLV